MSGLLDKASKDFRESFRVAGRGAVNNQYFTHALLHVETVLFPYTRSFGPEKAMRTREAEKSPCVRKFLCRMPKDCFRGGIGIRLEKPGQPPPGSCADFSATV